MTLMCSDNHSYWSCDTAVLGSGPCDRVTLPSPEFRSPPNDCRINCKTASHGDGDRGTRLAPYSRLGRARRVPPSSVDCSRAALAARATKLRFVNFLQRLGRTARINK